LNFKFAKSKGKANKPRRPRMDTIEKWPNNETYRKKISVCGKNAISLKTRRIANTLKHREEQIQKIRKKKKFL